MSNRYRGDVSITLEGERHVLRLTLGALAEIEAAFGVSDLQALGERLAAGKTGARDLITLLAAAMRGGGATLADEAVGRMVAAEELPRVVEAISAVFALSFAGENTGEAKPRAPRPLKPQRA